MRDFLIVLWFTLACIGAGVVVVLLIAWMYAGCAP
jgi:hypothetical protein